MTAYGFNILEGQQLNLGTNKYKSLKIVKQYYFLTETERDNALNAHKLNSETYEQYYEIFERNIFLEV